MICFSIEVKKINDKIASDHRILNSKNDLIEGNV